MTGPRLGVIAGGGELPQSLARHARAAGRGVYVLGLTGFAAPEFVAEYDGGMFSIGETGRQIDALRKAGCEEIVFAGIVKRPDLASLRFDPRGAFLAPALAAAALKGDDALMRVVIDVFEKAGFRVVGADDVLDDLLAPAGALGALSPDDTHWIDIRRAAIAATAIGALDIGQGAVACAGLVLAVEAQEGTDQMLARVATLPVEIRGTSDTRRGVLVKRPKPAQERRIDLPTIGVATIEAAANAGLAGVAVAARAALVLDRAKVAAAADRLGLFVYGFAEEDVA